MVMVILVTGDTNATGVGDADDGEETRNNTTPAWALLSVVTVRTLAPLTVTVQLPLYLARVLGIRSFITLVDIAPYT